MADPTDSFKKFNYGLRPSKQVERKVMIDVLLRLWKAGCDIRRYAYLGFGSVYYVDFVMFHRYLHIKDMTCIEWGDVAKRMKFNKPFKFIKLKIGALSGNLSAISSAKDYFIWLDYDRSLDNEILLDIEGCLARMRKGSIFSITVDARPKLPANIIGPERLPQSEQQRLTATAYREWFREYADKPVTIGDVAALSVSPLFYEVIVTKIQQTLIRLQAGLKFYQLFNFIYKDGAPMLTVGGLLCDEAQLATMQGSEISHHEFVRLTNEPLEISVPPLTIKEKQWLDSRLDSRLSAAELAFELEPELLDNYRRFYLEYPTYTESLL